MATYFYDIIIDQSTSCTRDKAVAMLLGLRSWDPKYHDPNSEDAPSEVFEHFEEGDDISVFEHLADEHDSALAELADAIKEEPPSQVKIDACNGRIVRCVETIRSAKWALCEIDDELAKGSDSKLRIDKDATANYKTTYITLSSLKDWSDANRKQRAEIAGSFLQSAPPANPSLPSEPLLEGVSPGIEDGDDSADDQGPLTKKGLDSLYLTLGVLIQLYGELAKEAIALVDSQPKTIAAKGINNDYKAPYPHTNAAKKCVDKNGDLINLKLAKHLETSAKPYGIRDAIRGQRYEMQLNRIEEALRIRAEKLPAPRPTEAAAQIT